MGFAPENQVRTGLTAGGRWIRTFGSRTRHQAVRRRRGRFPAIGSSPHWSGGTWISNLRPLAGWISALERGRFQGHKQKRKLKSVAHFARNRKFESISLLQRVRPTKCSGMRWDVARGSRLMARSTEQMHRIGNRVEEATAAAFASMGFAFHGEPAQALAYGVPSDRAKI